MGAKITIIGAGSVGATIAYTLSQRSFTTELVLIDINKEKAMGEVMDIEQGTCFRDPISIVAGDYEDARNSDIVIITSGIARKPGQTRIELTQTNTNIIKDIAPKIAAVAPDAKYIIVSNPVDIMTYVFMKVSGLPEKQIIGSGTLLDTARLRYSLSSKTDIAQRNIHAYVFGEHGDTSFIPWSAAYLAGQPMEKCLELLEKSGHGIDEIDRDDMLHYVQKSGGQIIANKGATFYAIAITVARLCELLTASSASLATVSTMLHGEYGIEDVCLSILTKIGPGGMEYHIPVELNEEEMEKLRASANALKSVIAQIEL